jgi:hypothetical protein
MYDPRAIFSKEPAVIAEAIRAILFVLVLAGLVNVGEELLAGIALVVSLILSLFVYQSSTPTAFPTLSAGTSVNVQGSEDKVVIQPSPPGPTGIEGTPDGP